MIDKKLCLYCQTINSSDQESCAACGAPLTTTKQTFNSEIERKSIPFEEIKTKPEKEYLETAKKVGKDADELSKQVWGLYGLFWRTIGEAITIAVVSFGLGVIGGATSLPVWGIIAGITFGILVGIVIKSYLWLLVGTPIGFIIGAVVGILLSVLGLGPTIILFVVFLFSSFSVFIGGHIRKPRQKNIYEKIRPLLGGIGGFIFSLIGVGIGLGLAALVTQLY